MALIIEDSELNTARITEDELRIEIAILLYKKGNFSLGKASEFARINKIHFQKEIGKRGIDSNYDADELQKDIKTLGF